MNRSHINIFIQDSNRYFVQGLIALLQSACRNRQTTMTFFTQSPPYLVDLIIVSNDAPSFIWAGQTRARSTKQIVLLTQDRVRYQTVSSDQHEAHAIKHCDNTNIVLQLINSVFKKYRNGSTNKAPYRLSVLTPREFQVLSAIEQGLQPDRIARRLGLSVKTVSTHKCNAMRKLGFSRNHQLYDWLRHHNTLTQTQHTHSFSYRRTNETIGKSAPLWPHNPGL